MKSRVAIGLALVLGIIVCHGRAEAQYRFRNFGPVKLDNRFSKRLRAFSNIKGFVVLDPRYGKPVGKGTLVVQAAKKVPFKPGGGLGQPQWKTVKTTKIVVTSGATGPWAYQLVGVPPNTPLDVSVRYYGLWSAPLGGGPARGMAGPVTVAPGKVKTVKVILKGVPIR